MGLGLLLISLNHYFHFLLNIKEYDVKFSCILHGSTTSLMIKSNHHRANTILSYLFYGLIFRKLTLIILHVII